jgi:hypothetical protein
VRNVHALYSQWKDLQRKAELEASSLAAAPLSHALTSSCESTHRKLVRASASAERGAVGGLAASTMAGLCRRFVHVLRAHYPYAPREMIEAMLSAIAPAMEAHDRRRWIARAKATQGSRLRQAFTGADADASGGLSLDEFVAAILEAQASADARSDRGPRELRQRSAWTAEELRALFSDADADGNGALDVDEFLALCAEQPMVVASFDAIVDAGVRRARRRDESHGMSIFRAPRSPSKRALSRPSLAHLRPIHELVSQHSTALPR